MYDNPIYPHYRQWEDEETGMQHLNLITASEDGWEKMAEFRYMPPEAADRIVNMWLKDPLMVMLLFRAQLPQRS